MTAAPQFVMSAEDDPDATENPESQPSLRVLPDVLGLRANFSQLMREHHLDLLVFAGAIAGDRDAGKDIVQDALVSAWKKFDQFDPAQGDFGAWMRGIIRYKAKDFFRKMQRTPIPDLDLVEMEVDMAAWQSSRAAGTGVFEKVERCLSKLPEKMSDAVQRFYFEDRSGEDAAKILEISAANLRKRLERARSLLHECLSIEEGKGSPQ